MKPAPLLRQPLTKKLTAFGRALEGRWSELDMLQAEFCRRIGKPAGWVQQIRIGQKTPPIEHLGTWADALRLAGPRRACFLDYGALAHVRDDKARERLETIARMHHGEPT